jgi:excinuclease ABC subunit A
VSGAGKSSLIRGIVFQGVEKSIRENSNKIQSNQFNLLNGNLFRKAIEVSQSPIGKTSRSTPATYLGVWSRIRELIANLPEAKALGLSSGDFSFNVQGGRCESCKGAGVIKVEMNFLPDSYIRCEQCLGKRYKDELIQLRWHGKNIAEILEMTFEEAEVFFQFDEVLHKTFSLMTQTGLGYLKLGQTSPTLSGGEAQRLKLASELANGLELKSRKSTNSKKNFYVLEEPTIGLHPQDCQKLTHLLHELVDDGHTVVVIEHDVDLIAEADYVIEVGPKGGLSGGRILHEGTIQSLLRNSKSQTAHYLKKVISQS